MDWETKYKELKEEYDVLEKVDKKNATLIQKLNEELIEADIQLQYKGESEWLTLCFIGDACEEVLKGESKIKDIKELAKYILEQVRIIVPEELQDE